MIALRMRKNGRFFILFLVWTWIGGASSFGSSGSPFAKPGVENTESDDQANKLPAPIKFKPPIKQQPSPYELRGYYQFKDKWRFSLSHRNNREGVWLSWDKNSTSVKYAGETFKFDTETMEVEHEGYQSFQLVALPKPTGKPFTPSPATPAPTPGNKSPRLPGNKKPTNLIPPPGGQFKKTK